MVFPGCARDCWGNWCWSGAGLGRGVCPGAWFSRLLTLTDGDGAGKTGGGGAWPRRGVFFPAGGATLGGGPGACSGRGVHLRPRPRSPAVGSVAPWPEKGGILWAEEVPRLQAVTAGNHDCSGPKVPSIGTQRVSGRAGPGRANGDRGGLRGKSVPLGQLTNQGAG